MLGTIRHCRNFVTNRIRREAYRGIYEKFKDFTMIEPNDYIANLLLAHKYRGTNGCVIECGTWRGGMIAGISEVLGPDRPYFLFDSFEGLPAAKPIDGEAALHWQADTKSDHYHNNCTAPVERAQRAMTISRADNYRIVEGWFDQTLPSFVPPQPIAILRLDADWYDSTITCLKYLYPFLAPKGIVLIDDYHTWDGCSKAVHDYLSEHKSSARIGQMHGVCVLMPR
jgi:O-methyltransferase